MNELDERSLISYVPDPQLLGESQWSNRGGNGPGERES